VLIPDYKQQKQNIKESYLYRLVNPILSEPFSFRYKESCDKFGFISQEAIERTLI
jgi:hypothetical protein